MALPVKVKATVTSKMLGDAGEHFALSQFSFAGRPCSKMPDGWTGYDLAVETGAGLARVSVKTRSESAGWRTSRWFTFDERLICDWLVFVFKPAAAPARAWVIPFELAREHGNRAGASRKEPHVRDVSWAKLTSGGLERFEGNWTMDAVPARAAE